MYSLIAILIVITLSSIGFLYCHIRNRKLRKTILDAKYNDQVDFIEREIYQVKIDHYKNFISDDVYEEKQEYLFNQLEEIKNAYLRQLYFGIN